MKFKTQLPMKAAKNFCFQSLSLYLKPDYQSFGFLYQIAKLFVFQDWKFVLTVAGSELPQVSLKSLDQVLKAAPGSIIESRPDKAVMNQRIIKEQYLER